MENLVIKAKKDSPDIILDDENNTIRFIGKSYPEDSFEFYKPVMAWLKEFIEKPNNQTIQVSLNIIYMNSSSFKVFFDIFNLLKQAKENGFSFDIQWIYDEENDVAEEVGEEFQEDFESLDIKLVAEK